MRIRLVSLAIAVVAPRIRLAGRSLGLVFASLLAATGLSAQDVGHAAKVDRHFGSTPLYFEENRGQTDAAVRYLGRADNALVFVTADGLTLSSRGDAVSMRVVGADAKARVEPEGSVGGITNYYLGSRAITALRHHASVRASNIRPGIDILYHGHDGQLEYDFVIHPGADPAALRLRFESAIRPVLSENGDLVFNTKAGDLVQRKPRVWQQVGGGRREIGCHYRLSGPAEVRLVLAKYNRAAELVIDPVLSYSTFLGGSNSDSATGIAVDSNGYAYVTGSTSSTNFPVTSGTNHGGNEAFVTKLNPSGTGLIYSTFIGGASSDSANGIAIDNAGNAYITGFTVSSDFPFTINSKVGTGSDAFVVKLGSTGNIVYATALAGTGSDVGNAIAVDTSGSAYIAGSTSSNDFPATQGSYRMTAVGGGDAFVAKLTPPGQISYATYLGGTANDSATAIAIDASGNAYVGGTTLSSNFPATIGAFATSLVGGQDAFIAKLDPAGASLVYATYLGGSSFDFLAGLAVDAAGNCYAAGSTQSNDFPTTLNAFSTSKPSASFNNSGFAVKLNAMGTSLVYGTYLGGSNNDTAAAVVVDLSGAAYVAGTSSSFDFPTTPGALRTRPSGFFGDSDIFLVKISTDGSELNYSTLLGATSTSDNANALALDGNGGLYLAGGTLSLNYPTTAGAFQGSNPKGSSAFITTPVVSKIDFSSPTLCNPSVSPSSQSVPGHGGTISFNLTLSPGCPWEALSDNFITVNAPTHAVISTSPVAISGMAAVNNDTVNARTGTIRIGTATFTVNQAAGSCQDPVVSPVSASFDSSGGLRDISLKLPSSCSWSAIPNVPWLIVTSNASGNGSATVTIFAGQNSFSQRTGTLTLAGAVVSVTQSGTGMCTATAGASPSAFSGQGGTGLIRITTNLNTCAWTAYSTVPWIQFAPSTSSGQGSGSVPFIVASNPGLLARSAQLLIADQTVTISQSAGPAGTVSSYTLSTFAGGGSSSIPNLGDGGPALGAYLNNPRGLAFDPASGNLYIIDQNGQRVRAVTPDGKINTIAGGGSLTGENIPATSALLSNSVYVAVDSSSSIYVDDSGSRVRKISQGNIATFAGTTSIGFSGDNGPATSALLNNPLGIAAAPGGNVYFADSFNNRIRGVNGGTITTFAGGGNSSLGDNGPAIAATLQNPQGVASDAAGNVYIADNGDSRIRKVSQGTITTVAGGGSGGDGGPATSASIFPTAIALDPLGELFLINSNFSVRRVALDGTITTIAGQFCCLGGIAADTSGNVYYSDESSFTNVIRKLTALPTFCTYSVATPSTIPVNGGPLAISVSTAGACNWTATSDLAWLTIVSGSSGSGNGTVNFAATANPGSSPRSGTVTIAGQAILVTQGSSSLNIAKSHAGNFTRGQQNATYSVLVSNANGVAPTSGTVMVAEMPPAGLTVVSMSGMGWTCGTTTCTRSDALASGSGYPAITVTVNVAANVTSPQVNQVSVSGGGSANANASDSTTILSQPSPAKGAIFRDGLWVIDLNGNFQWDGTSIDRAMFLGQAGDIPVTGDWNGDGRQKAGIFRNGLWLLDYNGNGQWDGTSIDRAYFLGQAGDIPVVGDWNGTGFDKIGIFRNGLWVLDYNGNGQWDGTSIDRAITLGQAGDVPVVGDWNGSGTAKVAVFRNGLWVFDYNGNGQWDGPGIDRFMSLGQSGDIPVVGDWNGSGTTKCGVFRNGLWVLDYNGNFQWDGTSIDRAAVLGQSGDVPVVGDWNGSGSGKIGIFRNGLWVFDYNGNFQWDGTTIDRAMTLGQMGDVPVAAKW